MVSASKKGRIRSSVSMGKRSKKAAGEATTRLSASAAAVGSSVMLPAEIVSSLAFFGVGPVSELSVVVRNQLKRVAMAAAACMHSFVCGCMHA